MAYRFFEGAENCCRKKKFIILNFSGSDWCVPCIRTKKEIFDTETFVEYSSQQLVLVNADFPRLKKNKLNQTQVKDNEALAEKYNPGGTFPLTLLLTADGTIVKRWEGFPNVSSAVFVQEIKNAIDAAGQ